MNMRRNRPRLSYVPLPCREHYQVGSHCNYGKRGRQKEKGRQIRTVSCWGIVNACRDGLEVLMSVVVKMPVVGVVVLVLRRIGQYAF